MTLCAWLRSSVPFLLALLGTSCGEPRTGPAASRTLQPKFFLGSDKVHSRFSRLIPPVLRVPSGAVIQVDTREVTDNQLSPSSKAEALLKLNYDPMHPLSGPVYVEGAEPGDVLSVTIHKIEIGTWGWAGSARGFGILKDEPRDPVLKIFTFKPGVTVTSFPDRISIPIRPLALVMGGAPPTDSILLTGPPSAHHG